MLTNTSNTKPSKPVEETRSFSGAENLQPQTVPVASAPGAAVPVAAPAAASATGAAGVAQGGDAKK